MHPHFSLYTVCAHMTTHTELSPNMVSLKANTDCAPYICLSFFFLCKPNLLLERRTQTAMHLTRPSLHITVLLLLSMVLYIWHCIVNRIFSFDVIIILMRKRIKRGVGGVKKHFLAVQDWTCNACSLSSNQELYPLMVAYGRCQPSRPLT